MGYRSVVSNPELEIDLTGSRITREEWEKIDREVIQGGLGENLEFRTWFTRGDKGEEVLASLEVVEGNLEPYTAYDLVEQMGRLRELLMSHGVERFSLIVTRTGDADASDLDLERVRITPEGVFTQHAEIAFSAWRRFDPLAAPYRRRLWVMSDTELRKSLERTITTSGSDTYVETSWPRGNNDAPR